MHYPWKILLSHFNNSLHVRNNTYHYKHMIEDVLCQASCQYGINIVLATSFILVEDDHKNKASHWNKSWLVDQWSTRWIKQTQKLNSVSIICVSWYIRSFFGQSNYPVSWFLLILSEGQGEKINLLVVLATTKLYYKLVYIYCIFATRQLWVKITSSGKTLIPQKPFFLCHAILKKCPRKATDKTTIHAQD